MRLFAHGLISVPLGLYLQELGFSDQKIGLLLTLIFVGDALFSLFVTYNADRFGRRRILVLETSLMILGGLVYAWAPFEADYRFAVLAAAGVFGVLNPLGMEALEQSAISGCVEPAQRTMVFSWSQAFAYVFSALGAVSSGLITNAVDSSVSKLDGYRIVMATYAAIGLVLGLTFCTLSKEVEVFGDDEKDAKATTTSADLEATSSDAPPSYTPTEPLSTEPLPRELRRTIFHLCLLFSIDAFAGSLVRESMLALWFHERYGMSLGTLAPILGVAQILAGASTLLSPHFASWLGLVRTIAFTDLPSSILVALLPMTVPNLSATTAFLFIRSSISEMDVAPRTAYVTSIVPPQSRTAILGITSIVRSLARAMGPSVTGYLSTNGMFDTAFILCGGLKIAYDVLLLWSFDSVKPPQEIVRVSAAPAAEISEEQAVDERTPLLA
ncbi:hypothetical protein HDU93_002027 [Gonapodya sp. JEL0774]|nr:hypothetical protein HDU93_002027 [Gonapodya sp. JEL0774]